MRIFRFGPVISASQRLGDGLGGIEKRWETGLPAGGLELLASDLLVGPAAFAVEIARAGRGQRAGEALAQALVAGELGERGGVTEVEDFRPRQGLESGEMEDGAGGV